MTLDLNKTTSHDVKLKGPIVKNNIQTINKKIDTGENNNKINPGFSVQVGSFQKIELAEFLATDLGTKGYPVYVESAFIDEKSEVLYRVFVGRFSTKIEAEKIGIKVKEVEGLASVIKWHEGVSSKVLYD
jgi:cell division septation protein DedD